MIPKVVQVVPTEDYKVYVYFEDGKITLYDVTPLLDGPVFEPLKDIKVFVDACGIINDTLAWDISGQQDPYECIDIDPITLYNSQSVNDMIA